jgi:hypothetical protein
MAVDVQFNLYVSSPSLWHELLGRLDERKRLGLE